MSAGSPALSPSFDAGPNPTTYLIAAEVFPTSLRASGAGLGASAGKLGAAFGIFLLPILHAAWGLTPTPAVVIAACLLGAVLTLALGVDTAGTSLEDVGTA